MWEIFKAFSFMTQPSLPSPGTVLYADFTTLSRCSTHHHLLHILTGEMEEEEMDSITKVPANCSVLRSSMRSLSPFWRHSWGPGKKVASDAEMNQRSSLRVLGDVVRRPPIHKRSFSLEGLTGGAGVGNKPSSSLDVNSINTKELRHPFNGEERGDSLVSLSEEDLESGQREHRMLDQQACHRSKQQGFNYCTSAISSPLTKSISLMTISHPGLDHSRPFHSTSANLTESITEETYSFLPQSPSKKDFEGKNGTKVSRTFSYIKNKMSSSKKSREKEKQKEKCCFMQGHLAGSVGGALDS
ncbi:unnamed protein product [Nyctereutes procyonoides]|uniref:(raccoon dog) hypothetical protein n=1 Tax=Nyctereutes procyonoides TaxID=34880 RepID=A0A811ZB45_NYCPR|nr:unnamed protein product [Nyctereutes procyonoides]